MGPAPPQQGRETLAPSVMRLEADNPPSTCNSGAGRGRGGGRGVGRGAFLGACHKLDLEEEREESQTWAKLLIHVLLPAVCSQGTESLAPHKGGIENRLCCDCLGEGEVSERYLRGILLL